MGYLESFKNLKEKGSVGEMGLWSDNMEKKLTSHSPSEAATSDIMQLQDFFRHSIYGSSGGCCIECRVCLTQFCLASLFKIENPFWFLLISMFTFQLHHARNEQQFSFSNLRWNAEVGCFSYSFSCVIIALRHLGCSWKGIADICTWYIQHSIYIFPSLISWDYSTNLILWYSGLEFLCLVFLLLPLPPGNTHFPLEPSLSDSYAALGVPPRNSRFLHWYTLRESIHTV